MSKSPDPIDLHVGARLRYRRMLIGMSQEALAEKLGLTFQQIQKYEKGQNRVGASRLYQIAQILEVSVGYFFEELPDTAAEDGDPRHAHNPLDFVSSQEGLQLNLAFNKIDDDVTRRRLVELVRALAGCRNGEIGAGAAG